MIPNGEVSLFKKSKLPSKFKVPGVTSKEFVNVYCRILSSLASPINSLWPSGLNAKDLKLAHVPIKYLVSLEVDAVERS